MNIGYKIVRAIVKPIAYAIFGIKVIGKENIPQKGPYIVCANHTSVGDVGVLFSIMKEKVYFITKKEAFKNPFFARFLSFFGGFPVDRDKADVGAIKTTISLLKEEKIVAMFPQGTRYKGIDPRETRVKDGVGMLAWHSDCGVLPIRFVTKHNYVRPFNKTVVIIGQFIKYDDFDFENGGLKEYKQAAIKVFENICTLGEDYVENKNS